MFKTPRPPRPVSTSLAPRRIASASAPSEPQAPQYVEEPGSATVLTLGAHMCKWPIGDPSSDSFTFCGRRINDGSYCVEHARVAYQPQQKGKKGTAADLARSLRRYI